ncbi:MAG TPA: hypothetical protein ENH96_02860 [Chlamydiae bacterium]|nr:hypothetical protein [Chlamydiota bacterium]
MKVFNVIDQNSNIFGKKLIEASAGTGKTFAIEHLFVRLLLEKDDLNIEEILVVTFTNAATKELKFRIRKNLSEAINILKRKNLDFETFSYLTEHLGQKDKISKLEDALDLFETANIFTIHSFCFKALNEFAFEADVLIDIDEKNDIFFIKDLIVDYLKFFIDLEKYLPEQIEILVNQHKDIDNLVLKISQNIDKNLNNQNSQSQDSLDLDSKSQGWALLFDNFKKATQNFKKTKIFEEIKIEDFEKISKNFKKIAKYKNEDFFSQLNSLISTINNEECSIEDFKIFIKNKLSIFEFLDEKNKKVKAIDYELPRVLIDLKNIFYPIIKKATDINILFYNLTSDIANFVDEFLETNEIFTFDKILQKMQKACKNENFSKKLKNRYKAAIIDEFQDTDPIQFDIFKTLFLKNEKILAFYLIGDPKQSIYSFRKADLYTYLEATKKIDEINYLDTNYRSTKPLIDSLNALLSKEFSKNWLKLPNIDDSLEYIPIKSGLGEDFDFQDDLAPIHFFISEASKVKKWPTDEMEIKNFTFIANEILSLKKNCQKLSNKNFAVLVKDRFQAQRLKNYFQKFSINSQTPRSSSLKNSICLNAMKEFLDACLHPNNLNKVKIALLGPFVQLNLQDLKNIDLQNFSKHLEKFHFLKSILNKKNLGEFFHHFFEISFENFSILENIAAKKDINFYLDCISLIELILAEKNLGQHNLLSFFKKLELLDQDDEKLKIFKNFEDGVHILTTFMSKGLEYDIVFALDLASKSRASFAQDLKEMDAEKMRQFYVAITRAKYRVYLPIAIDLKEKPILEGEYSAMEYFLAHILDTKDIVPKKNLLEKLKILKDKKLLSLSFVDFVKPSSFQDKEEDVDLSKPKDFSKKFESRYIYSFSSLTSTLDIKIEEKKQKSTLPKGLEVGEIFHKILENVFYKKSFQSDEILKIIQSLIKESVLESFEKEVFSIINNTLNAPLLGEDSFCLKDVEFNNFHPEVEFLFSWKKDYMKGFIDLVFEHQSKYYIIDWKSNYLSDFSKDYDTKNIEKEMSLHNYYLQAAIYTKSLKQHLKILNKDFEKVFGGVFYIFLRGQANSHESKTNNYGSYHFYPDLKVLDQMHNQKSRLDAR